MNKGFKIISDKDFKKIQLLKRPLVFVPMAADLLHHGHIRILNKASKYGTVIVGLMTDKGLAVYKSKPILTYAQREEMMLQIKPIDYIVPLNGLLYTEIAEILKLPYIILRKEYNFLKSKKNG